MKSIYKCEYCGFLCGDKEKMIAHEKECLKNTEDKIMEVFDDFYDELIYLAKAYSEEVISSAMAHWVEDKIKDYDDNAAKMIFGSFNTDNWKEIEKNLQEALNNLNHIDCDCHKCKDDDDDFRAKVKDVINKNSSTRVEVDKDMKEFNDFIESIFS